MSAFAASRRALRAGLVGLAVAATVLLSGCGTPAAGTYLQHGKTEKVVRAIMRASGSDQLLGARLGTVEASVRVVKDGQAETWSLREDSDEIRRTAIAPLEPTAHPRSVSDVDWNAAAQALEASDITKGCSDRGVRLSVDLQLGRPLIDMLCLDNSRHRWLSPDQHPYEVVDLRSPEGMQTALSEVREVVQTSQVTNVALVNDDDSRLDVEVPGACGNLVGCPAVRASRIARAGEEPPVVTGELPARLNYAVPIDSTTLDPAVLQPVMRRVLTEHRASWWDPFTVTIYQTGKAGPVMEFKVGHDVFWTDLAGAPATR